MTDQSSAPSPSVATGVDGVWVELDHGIIKFISVTPGVGDHITYEKSGVKVRVWLPLNRDLGSSVMAVRVGDGGEPRDLLAKVNNGRPVIRQQSGPQLVIFIRQDVAEEAIQQDRARLTAEIERWKADALNYSKAYGDVMERSGKHTIDLMAAESARDALKERVRTFGNLAGEMRDLIANSNPLGWLNGIIDAAQWQNRGVALMRKWDAVASDNESLSTPASEGEQTT